MNAAIAIIKRKKDTIRVILPCYYNLLLKKNKIAIKIIHEPVADDVGVLYSTYEKNKCECNMNVFDTTVLNTVFGVVVLK